MNLLMPPELFRRYCDNPLELDAEVRKQMRLPASRYYTVSLFPPELAGRLRVDLTRTRVVHATKVSKSDQK